MGETYMAISNGTVDAQANSTNNIISNKLFEVQDYLNITRHSFVYQLIVINKDLFYGFSPELQNLMRETFAKYAKLDIDMVASAEADEFKFLEGEGGMTIVNPDTVAMKAAFEPLYKQYNDKNGAAWADLMGLIN